MKLYDYFQPLNLKNIFICIALFIFFDIVGTLFKNIILRSNKVSEGSRLINWIIGLGLFVFIWFLIGFYIIPTQLNILICILILSIICTPFYIRNKEYKELSIEFKFIWPGIVIIVPLLPAVFVKASLPPYYADEMAYHFISPYAVNNLLSTFWNFDGGALMNAPRLMDTFFITIFSLTKTYSIIRLFLFGILATSLLYVFRNLKNYFNIWTGILFLLLFLGLPQDIVFTSTIGYVDISSYAFLMIGYLSAAVFLFDTKRNDLLIISSIFWGMSLGTKYPTLNAFGAFILSFSLIFLLFIKIKNKKYIFHTLLKSFILIFIFGGYWYLKNLIVYGNPIYPFVFSCWGKYVSDCKTGSNFFGDWTTKITLDNLIPIFNSLLPGKLILTYLSFVTPIFLFFKKGKFTKIFLLLAIITFVIEFISLKFMSGFQVRYQQHMQFFLLLSISISMFYFVRYFKFNGLVKYTTVLIFVFFVLINYIRVVKTTNSLLTVTWNEINYSVSKIDIYDWVRIRLPRIADAIFWCENPPGGQKGIARFDPDMIWYEDDGFMRSFLVNCYYENPSIITSSEKEMLTDAKNKKLKFWTATINKCMNPDKIVAKRVGESPEEVEMRKVNNMMVCNSKEIMPNFYLFDYQEL